MSIKINGKTVAEGIRIIHASDFSSQLDALVQAGVLTIESAKSDINQLVLNSISTLNNTTSQDVQVLNNTTTDGVDELNQTKDDLISELETVGFKNVGDIFYSLRTDEVVNGAYRCLGQEFNKDRFVGMQNPYDLIVSGRLHAYSLSATASARDYITYTEANVSSNRYVNFTWLQVGLQEGKTTTGFNNIITEYPSVTVDSDSFYGNVTPSSLSLTDYNLIGICAFTDAAGTQVLFAGSLIEDYTYFYSTDEPTVSTYAFWYNPAENEWKYKVSGNAFKVCYATPILYTKNSSGAITISPVKTTVSEYEHQLELNLECPWFGIDTINERFKLPTLPKAYIQGDESSVGYYYPYVQLYGGDRDISLIDYTEEVNQAIVDAKADLDDIVDEEKQTVYDYTASLIDEVNQAKADAQAAADAAADIVSVKLNPATDTRLGGVKIGEGINVTADGTISAAVFETETIYAWEAPNGDLIFTSSLNLNENATLYNADGTVYTGTSFVVNGDFVECFIAYRGEKCTRKADADTTRRVTISEMFRRIRKLEEQPGTWA